jgi:hypothetical protein
MRTARKPSAVARELLRNFPKGGKKRRRRKKSKDTTGGTPPAGNGSVNSESEELDATPPVEKTANAVAIEADEIAAYSSDQDEHES